jgi:addiction module RelB/DinJ family antitoxin
MSRIIRSAMLQMRVSPEIKLASEHVLRRIGLNLTDATELFLRRMIIDQRIPFEVVAFDNATFARLLNDFESGKRSLTKHRHLHRLRRSQKKPTKRKWLKKRIKK